MQVPNHTKKKDHVKDLGIFMHNDATFTHHTQQITNYKGIQQLGAKDLSNQRKPLLTLWRTLLLPRVEYCCLLWSPHKIQDIAALEGPQKTFTNKIQGLQHIYCEWLKYLHTYSLQRREEFKVIYIWKILEGIVPNVGVEVNIHVRKGRFCFVKGTQGNTQRVMKIIHNSHTQQ